MNEIALLIPHYNNFNGLKKSLASIDEREELDIIVVDDGSVSNKIIEEELVKEFNANGKVIFLYLKSNEGIEHALNFGLRYIVQHKYKYTARLDAGDICIGERFKIQRQFLIDNPNIKFIGSNADAYDMEGNFMFKFNFPISHNKIKKAIYLNAVFVHPTFMFDNDILDCVGLYPTMYKAAEDFAFTMKIVKMFNTANIPESLVRVEINPKGISISQRNSQVWSRFRTIKDNFYFGFYPIYGLVRNYLICVMPDKWFQALKKYIK